MKKNKMMRLASGLLVAVLLTSSVVSGTFAKYVTEGSATDTARVAKWGVEIIANGDMFATEYAKDDVHSTLTSNTVISMADLIDPAGNDDVVAPGTKGDMVSMTLTGQPEVAVKVTYKANLDFSEHQWVDKDGNYYCPLVVTVNGTPFDGATYTSVDKFEEEVEKAIVDYTKEYEANTPLSTVTADSLKVSWSWPFSTSEANDVKDTFLGNQAANGNPATVTLTVETTVEQVD